MKNESNYFDACNLTTAQPAVSDSLLVELARPELSGDLMMLKQPRISGDVTLKQPRISGDMTLKQPRISVDLSQQSIHLLMPPEENNNPKILR